MPFMPKVKGNGIAGEKLPHQVAERTPACSDQKMEMVAQQCPCVTLATSLLKSLFQVTQEVISIMAVKKNILAVYPPPDKDMMDRTRHIDTFVSRHDRMLQIQRIAPSLPGSRCRIYNIP